MRSIGYITRTAKQVTCYRRIAETLSFMHSRYRMCPYNINVAFEVKNAGKSAEFLK